MSKKTICAPNYVHNPYVNNLIIILVRTLLSYEFRMILKAFAVVVVLTLIPSFFFVSISTSQSRSVD